MMFKAAAALTLAAVVSANSNPHIVKPNNMTYHAGDVMEISWTGASTGFVNIDLVDVYPEVLQFPVVIAAGVPAESGSYKWKLPSELKSASGYYLRVWGDRQPMPGSDGCSKQFTVLNTIPNAINTFTVTSPNKDKPCASNAECVISWDYPTTGVYPAAVDIALYAVGNPNPLMNIATVPAAQKSYTWKVPSDSGLLGSNVYVAVSGSGNPMAGPGLGSDMGANSPAFTVADPPPFEAKTDNMDGKKDDKMEKKDAKDEKKDKKDEKKMEKKPEPPKVNGASKKQASAASAVSATGFVLVLAAALPLALLL